VMPGKLVIFSAPSGSGKTTLVNHLLRYIPGLSFSVSACSRGKRPHEIDGRDYYFLSAGEFREKIANGEFIEWEEVYPEHFYGTLRSEVERLHAAGRNVIFDVDVRGGMNIKQQYEDKALSVFVMPPSIEELERRLTMRSTETTESLRARLSKARTEIEYAPAFDVVIVNDDLGKAKKDALDTVTRFLSGQELHD
jgi:guanylate kinase